MTHDVSEEKLWRRYKEEDSQAAKEELVLRYLPLVKHIVAKVIINLPDKFSFEYLVNYGILGLLDALDRFDVQRNIKFSTYAVPRVKGTIYDELRSLDWVPQSVRREAKKLTQVYIDLENKLGRNPSDEELREELDLDKKEFRKLLNKVNIPDNVSLDKIIFPNKDGKLTIKDLIPASDSEKPENLFQYNRMKEILGQAIDKLPKKEKIVVSLYYYDDLTLTEIGEVMDLTTARISQLHTKAIFRLRGYLSQKKDSLVG